MVRPLARLDLARGIPVGALTLGADLGVAAFASRDPFMATPLAAKS